MTNVFQSFNIQPSYGQNYCIITWSVPKGYERGEVYVYRSPTGVLISDDWVLVNPDNPVVNSYFYTDNTFYERTQSRNYYYRLVLEYNNKVYESAVIDITSGDLTRSEFGALYKMRRMEYLRMRHNGVRCLHMVPSIEGPRTPTYDPIYDEDPQFRCGDPNNPSFGTDYAEGYRCVIQTRVEILSSGPYSQEEGDEGDIKEKEDFNLRLLAFPEPNIGDIIAIPGSDTRFLIKSDIQNYSLKGIYDVAYDVKAVMLSKNDTRYKPVLPQLLEDNPFPQYIYFNAL